MRKIAICFSLIFCTQFANALPVKENQSILFSPLKNEDYTQAWNLFFYNDEIMAQITFIIGNLGPGDLNNGYAVVVSKKNNNIIFIRELSSNELSSKSDDLNIVMDNNNTLNFNDHGDFTAIAKNYDLNYSVTLNLKNNPFHHLHEHTVIQREYFVNQDIYLVTQNARLTVQNEQNIQEYAGWGGIEHLRINLLPSRYADTFVVARSKPGEKMIFIMGFKGNQKHDNKLELSYYILEKNKLIKSGRVIRMNISEKLADGAKKEIIPGTIHFILDDLNSCTITVKNNIPRGKLDVFMNITPFFKWILKLVFSEPSIYYYHSKFSYRCAGKQFETDGLVNYISM